MNRYQKVLLIITITSFVILAVTPAMAIQVDFGELEQVFTGLQQATFIIGVILLFIGILLIFFPGLRIFLGKLVGMS